MNKIVFSLFLSAICNLLFAIPASAACQPIFGGGSMCEQKGKVTIDKTVKRPDGNFVDSLSLKETPFNPGDPIEFKIEVKNTDTRAIKNIIIKDTIPSAITSVTSNGKFDGDKTVTVTINELKGQESKTYSIKGTLVHDANGCFANAVTLTQSQNTNQDASEFCVQSPKTQNSTQDSEQQKEVPSTTKGGQPIYEPQITSEMPSTGPEMIPLVALIPTAVGGYFLRKKSRSISKV